MNDNNNEQKMTRLTVSQCTIISVHEVGCAVRFLDDFNRSLSPSGLPSRPLIRSSLRLVSTTKSVKCKRVSSETRKALTVAASDGVSRDPNRICRCSSSVVRHSAPTECWQSARSTVEGWRYRPNRKCCLGRVAAVRRPSSAVPNSLRLQGLTPPENLQFIAL